VTVVVVASAVMNFQFFMKEYTVRYDLVIIFVTFLFCLRMARGGDTALIINYHRPMMRSVVDTTTACSETAAAAVLNSRVLHLHSTL